MIRILFLSANPSDLAPLKVDEEYYKIETELRSAHDRDHFELLHEPKISRSKLHRVLLKYDPQIVHFSGSGGEEGLIFENEMGTQETVPPDALTNIFKILGKNIRCVFLNTCRSEKQAKAIAKHVDCAIGMSGGISDRAAIIFSASFYLALAHARSVKDAFNIGCNELILQEIPGEDIPKLKNRAGVNPSKVVLTGAKPDDNQHDSSEELRDIRAEIDRLKQEYDRVTYEGWSIIEFWNKLARFVQTLTRDDQSKELLRSHNIDSLNNLLINLSTHVSEFRRERELGNDLDAGSRERRIRRVSHIVLEKLDEIYSLLVKR